ncbi:hypothetical protein [Rhizobium glycinendophyticum]|nr:hypothetical protein [Rhizobium glycinendophyticum]
MMVITGLAGATTFTDYAFQRLSRGKGVLFARSAQRKPFVKVNGGWG